MLLIGLMGAFAFFCCLPSARCATVGGQVTMGPGEERAERLTPKINVKWSFSSSNPNVNITLVRYTESCYELDGWYSPICEDRNNGSGTWNVPTMWSECYATEEEKEQASSSSELPPFYFVFKNTNNEESTILTYDLKIDEELPFPAVPGFYGCIAILISSLAICSIIVARKIKKIH